MHAAEASRAGSFTLTAWIYDSPMGAAAGEVRMWDLREHGVILVEDAVTVTWISGAHRPRIGHLRHPLGTAPGRGAVLPNIVRFLLRPSLDPSQLSKLARKLNGSGIDHHFLHEVRSALVPGTSALMVLSDTADLDDVRPAIERGLARGDVSLLHVWLARPALEILRRASDELETGSRPEA